MNARPLAAWDIAAPPTWGGLPLVPLDDADPYAAQLVRAELEATAADLTTDVEAQERLLGELTRIQPTVAHEGLALLAAWVPDPIAGVIMGMMTAELMADAQGCPMAQFRAELRPEPVDGGSVLRFDVDEVELPAGPALLIDALGSDEAGDVHASVRFVCYPPGASEAVILTFDTTALHLSEELVADAWAVARSMVLELAEGA